MMLAARARRRIVGCPRFGLTLIELLVVISIMMLLAVIAIPRMRPGMENRRVREAARALNVFISAARNRAIENGRPFGVQFERDPNLLYASVTVYQVEVPPPYAGDSETSRIVLGSGSPTPVSFTTGEDPALLISTGVVHVGDRLRLDYRGPDYVITALAGNQWTFAPQPPATGPGGLPFQIFRQPVRSSASPYELPNEVVVDLQYSGLAVYPTDPPGMPTLFSDASANATPVTILFSPQGHLAQVASHTLGTTPCTRPIYLLVGKRSRVPWAPGDPSPAEDGMTNLQDLTNLWLAVNPQTGYVSCAEMAPGAPDVTAARAIAREFQTMGGR